MNFSDTVWYPRDVGVLLSTHVTPAVPVLGVLWTPAARVSIARPTHDVGGAETIPTRAAGRNQSSSLGTGSPQYRQLWRCCRPARTPPNPP